VSDKSQNTDTDSKTKSKSFKHSSNKFSSIVLSTLTQLNLGV